MFLKADDLLLLFLPKNIFSFNPFFVQIGPKRFYQFSFRTTGLQRKLLILIDSSNIFHWKSAKKSKVGVVFGTKFGPD